LRRQDLICLSLYYLGFSRIRNLIFRFFRIPVTRILAFHDVPDHLVENFYAQMQILKKKVNVISLDDFFARKMSWGKINVAITFDDGYRSWVDNVLPVLKDLGVNATFFVSSGFVGRRKEQEAEFLRNNLRSSHQTTGSLDAIGLRNLAEQGFAIGGHTSNHANLTEFCDINELRNEIQKDKKELERMAETRVDYFAYPFGFHQNPHMDLVRVLQESGYRGAVTTLSGFNTTGRNSYLLHRDLVNAAMPISVFKARLLGNQDGITFVRETLRFQYARVDAQRNG
jgi:peptidoglycan/xylan/chitin deacetylase (PgdA/CDA1 family)